MACKGFDEQVVRLDKEIADLAKEFILVRVTNMRGVDLNTFDFDYDLTWMGFFQNAEGHTYGRFGGRDSEDAEKHLTLAALKHAMRSALEAYRRDPAAANPAAVKPPRFVEQLPAAKRLKPDACIHCHQVYEFGREEMRRQGVWNKKMAFVYPPPESIGVTIDDAQGSLVKSVRSGSAAAGAGIRPGDRLSSLNGKPVASFADITYALQYAPEAGEVGAAWRRGGKEEQGALRLQPGWRTSDISWRASMWGVEPAASVYGPDLTAEEKRALGLSADALAFRQGDFVPADARNAGIRKGDIILGIDDKPFKMTMLKFNAYVRLNYNPGDRITFNGIRDGQRLNFPMVLPSKVTF